MKENELILASGSPRRRELLSLYTTDFTVCVSDFDESAVTAPTPAQLVEQLAIGKCLAVAKQHPDAVVIGCDTVVDVDGTVFGKPHDAEDAKRMLRALSGKTHQVHTGVCIAKGHTAAVRYIVCHSEVGQVRKDGVIPDFYGVVGGQGPAATSHGLHIVYVDFVVIGIYRFPDVTFGLCFLFTPALCCCGLHGKHSRQT